MVRLIETIGQSGIVAHNRIVKLDDYIAIVSVQHSAASHHESWKVQSYSAIFNRDHELGLII